MVFSYRACSDEQSYDAFHIELSRRIVIEAACRGRDKPEAMGGADAFFSDRL
nr:hypothetical protein [Evansella caseinilytica]